MQKTKLLILFGRALKESFKNLWRQRALSIAVITVITIIIFIFNLLFAINTQARQKLDSFSQKVDIILYLKDKIEYHTIKNIIEDMKKIEGVIEINYTSKSEAIEKLSKNYPKIQGFFSKFEIENPLPASLNIKTDHPSSHQNVWDFVNGSRYSDLFDQNITKGDSENKYTNIVTKNLQGIIDLTEKILYLILATFLIGGILIIYNAIKLTTYARKKEIKIMRLIGVPMFFIKLPFVLEAIWFFSISTLFGILAYSIFVEKIFELEGLTIWGWTLFAGIITGIISSLLVSTKHLNA